MGGNVKWERMGKIGVGKKDILPVLSSSYVHYRKTFKKWKTTGDHYSWFPKRINLKCKTISSE